MDPAALVEAIQVLILPDDNLQCKGGGKKNRFDQLLLQNLQHLHDHLCSENATEDMKLTQVELEELHSKWCTESLDVRWKFVVTNLHLLIKLKNAQEIALKLYKKTKMQKAPLDHQAPPLSPDTLSLSQQKIISTSLQFTVCLGLCPNLMSGIGLPVELRSEFGNVLQVASLPHLSEASKIQRLLWWTKCILLCIDQPSLNSLIVTRHLGDMLAALCQLCYAPRKRKSVTKPDNLSSHEILSKSCIMHASKSKDTASGTSDCAGVDRKSGTSPVIIERVTPGSNGQHTADTGIIQDEQSDLSVLTDDERGYCERQLSLLVERVYQPLLIRELMVLQNGSGHKQPKQGMPNSSPPSWLRRVCSRLLSQRLLKPHGVLHVVQGMLQGSGKDISVTDWRKCDATAKIIASCSTHCQSAQRYFEIVGPQILELLHSRDMMKQQFLRVSVSTIAVMYNSLPDLAWLHLIEPLLRPLHCCLKKDTDLHYSRETVVTEKDLAQCVEDIHKVYVIFGGPNSCLLRTLQVVIHPLFHLYCHVKHDTIIRKHAEESLVHFLQHSDETVALNCLSLLAFNQVEKNTDMSIMSKRLVFVSSSGGVKVILRGNCPLDSPGQEQHPAQLIELLRKLQKDGLAAEFFIKILQRLTDLISCELDDHDILLPTSSTSVAEAKHLQYNLTVLELLAEMCGQLSVSCFTSPKYIIKFVKTTLERCMKVLSNSPGGNLGQFETDTIHLSLGLLAALLGGAGEITTEDRTKTKELLPLLQSISEYKFDLIIASLASNLRVAVATHGKISQDLLLKDNMKYQKREMGKETSMDVNKACRRGDHSDPTNKPVIEVLSSKQGEQDGVGVEQTKLKSSEHQGGTAKVDADKEIIMSPMAEALEEIQDPLVPIKGHALIMLRKLLDKKDPEAMEKHETLLKIFITNLDHGDSYIYLAAIQGLAVLADHFPSQVLPLVLEEYASFDKTQRSAELRLKLGEVLVKVCRALGETIPRYRDVILRALLVGVRDDDPLVRASNVSNLGELCKMLRFSLGSVVNEVFECVSKLTMSDSDAEVRQASTMLLTLLLQGLRKDAFKVLDSVLRDLYKLLKQVLWLDKDEMVKVHAQLALDELNSIMKEALFPPPVLEKKIIVRNP